jgi:hypothetical protein
MTIEIYLEELKNKRKEERTDCAVTQGPDNLGNLGGDSLSRRRRLVNKGPGMWSS